MTTPKSPEQIMEDIEILMAGNFAAGTIEGSKYNADVNRKQIRSSMSSLLCYMAERMPEETGCELCSLNDGETHSCMIGPLARERNNAINDCRTLLIEEARKITDGEKTEEEVAKIQALSNMLMFVTGKKPNE